MDITTKQTVLIIDDDQNEVMLTKMVISEINPEIGMDVAFSGEAGLTLLRSGRPLPELILLDLKMRRLSGIDVLHHIRLDDRLKHLPVIIVTNSALESDKQKSIEAGADDYLHKAFDIERFSGDIKSLLERYLVKVGEN
jgi:DNA-binding response OmpR family regulator